MITLNGEIRVLTPYHSKQQKIHAAPTAATQARATQAAATRAAATSPPQGSSQPVAPPALRGAAIAADTSAAAELNLALLWRELARGTAMIEDGFFSQDRCYLVVANKALGSAIPIEGRRLEILEAVLGGMRQKNVAIDLALAPSTVALNSRLALESLGLRCKPSRAHPILMLAAKSATATEVVMARCTTLLAGEARELRVISLPRPDQRLSQVLPAAELTVIRLLVEGLSYAEIAQLRGTATRTVANQITAVFRRLQVSGRNELVLRLFCDEAKNGPVPPPKAETLAPPDTVRATAAAEQQARRSA